MCIIRSGVIWTLHHGHQKILTMASKMAAIIFSVNSLYCTGIEIAIIHGICLIGVYFQRTWIRQRDDTSFMSLCQVLVVK